MNFLSRAEIKNQFIEQGSSWVAQQQFWLFGTASYYDGEKIKRAEAEQDARHFFNMLDRKLICRLDYKENRRLPRLVFIESGRARDNTHIHFYIKGRGLKDYGKIKRFSEGKKVCVGLKGPPFRMNTVRLEAVQDSGS